MKRAKRKKLNNIKNKKHNLTQIEIDNFLDALISTASVTKACILSGVAKSTVYKRLQNDNDFRQRFYDVRKFAICLIEDEALRRAVDGVDRDIFFRGEYVGTMKNYSDRLLIQLMKMKLEDINNERKGSDDYDALSELEKEKSNIINNL